MQLSVIIPVYKQEKTIKKDIQNIYDVLSETRWSFEMIVVVDGFVDDSLKKAKEVNKKNIHVIGYKTNRGKGYAIRYGMARAKGEFIAFIDSGMEISPNSISMLLEHMEWYGADVVVGSKRHPASKVKLSTIRKIYSWGYFLGARILFGLKISDSQAGVKVYKRKVLEKVLPRLVVKQFAFDIEVLAVARRLGFTKIYDAPIEVNLDFTESSKFKHGLFIIFDSQIRDMIYDTVAVFYRMYILKYYDDGSKRKWVYDKELDMRVNTGM